MTETMAVPAEPIVVHHDPEYRAFFSVYDTVRAALRKPAMQYARPADRAEVIENVIVAAFQHWERDRAYFERYPVVQWACTLVQREARDVLRERRRRAERDWKFQQTYGKRRPAGMDPHEQLELSELAHAVERRFADLPARFREVARLRFLEGLAEEEIAQQVDLSPGTIKAYVRDARAHMTRALSAWSPQAAGDRGSLAKAFVRHGWEQVLERDVGLRRRLRLAVGGGSETMAVHSHEAEKARERAEVRFRAKLQPVNGSGGEPDAHDFDSFEALSADWERFLRSRGFDIIPPDLQAAVLVQERAAFGALTMRPAWWRRAGASAAVFVLSLLWWLQDACFGPLDWEE